MLTIFRTSTAIFPCKFSTFWNVTSISFVVNLFKQRKNKRFNYVSRLSQDTEGDLKSQWHSIRNKGKHKGGAYNRLILLLDCFRNDNCSLVAIKSLRNILIMGILHTRKNKKYNYTPRYYKGDGNPFELKHKFDDYRVTAGSNKGLKTKLNNALDDYKYNQDQSGANRRVLYIVTALILVFLFIIDFDISIFFPSS